jgi:methylthioribose-1-phosphate isomerase
MVLEAIKYRRGSLEILDQLKLPHQEIYLGIESPEDAWHAIKSMQVRGAPAIAIVAALSLAVVGAKFIDSTTESIVLHPEKPIPQFFSDKLKYLVTSRPTAVNLSEAATRLDGLVWTASKRSCSDKEVIETYIEAAEQMLRNDVNDNKNIGKFGAEWILQNTRPKDSTQKVSVVTHCNTGYLHSITINYEEDFLILK